MAREHRTLFLLAAALILSSCAEPQRPVAARAPATDPNIGCVSAVPPETPAGTVLDVSLLEQRVLAFSRAHIGRVLGTGQCAELADQALIASGARSFIDYAANTRGDDYVWGDPVDVTLARPGDVLQFRDFTMRVTTRTAGGAVSDESDDAEHHTVVVEENHGGVMTVFEQNVDDDPAVRRTHYFTVPGSFPGRGDGRADRGAVTTVRITGSVHAYRPESR